MGRQSSQNGGTWFDQLQLPAPSTLPLTEDGALPAGAVAGSGFRTEFGPENVTTQGGHASFDPHFAPHIPRREREAAWALYMLDMDGHEASQGFDLSWTETPEETEVWVALAHWKEDRWVWRRLNKVEEVPVPETSAYVRGADSALAAVLLTTGEDPHVLEQISSQGNGLPMTPPGGLKNEEAPLGTNLARIRDWNPSLIFTDAFRTARLWIPQAHPYDGTFDTGGTLHTDGDGNITHLDPGTAAAAIVMSDQGGVHPAGTYTLLYDGTGKIELRGEGKVIDDQPGRILVDLNPGTGLTTIRICETDPADPVRNIRFILPGFENSYQSQPFHPDFLASLDPFDVIRFTNWGNTDITQIVDWSDRPLPTVASTAMTNGAPLETMIALCNELDADMWYSVPHMASDDYIRRATTLIRDQLEPELRLHLEWSNEVWNWIFPQTKYASQQGIAKGYDSSVAHLHYYADRAKEMNQIAAQVFASQPDRLVRILSAQSANPWTGQQIMDWPAHDPASQYADVLAVAPYFGGQFGMDKHAPDVLTWTVERLLAECDADSVYRQSTHTRQNADNANSRGLELVAYEGGQHLVGVEGNQRDQALNDMFRDANRHHEMRRIYVDDLRRWDAEGGTLFMSFIHVSPPSTYGYWGLLESQYQSRNEAPKWLGVLDWKAEKEQQGRNQ